MSENGHYSLKDAAAALGVSVTKIRNTINELGLEPERDPSGRGAPKVILSEEQLARIAEAAAEAPQEAPPYPPNIMEYLDQGHVIWGCEYGHFHNHTLEGPPWRLIWAQGPTPTAPPREAHSEALCWHCFNTDYALKPVARIRHG